MEPRYKNGELVGYEDENGKLLDASLNYRGYVENGEVHDSRDNFSHYRNPDPQKGWNDDP